MSAAFPPIDRQDAASLLGWWLDAGVDVAIAEAPRNWLAPPEEPGPPEPRSRRPPPVEAPKPSPALPDTLGAFHAWLRESSDLPLFRAGAARALPHGPAEAEIMLVLGPPAAEDAQAGTPLSGDSWTLATRMLAAIGFKPEQAYVAPLTCFPSPLSRLAEADAEACAASMRRHIALVAPKRLLLLGDAAALAVLGEPMGKARGRIHRLDGTPVVATFSPRHLLARTSDKAHAWRDLLLLMSEPR